MPFFFPPFSIYKYAIDVQTNPQEFVQYKKLVERVVLEAELYSNADVYWFADKKYINNIANYKDLTHYNGGFNSFFLSEFSAKRSIINSSNYKQLLTDLENRAKNIDIMDLAKKLKKSSYEPFFKQYGKGYLVVSIQHPMFGQEALAAIERAWNEAEVLDKGFFKSIYIVDRVSNRYKVSLWKSNLG